MIRHRVLVLIAATVVFVSAFPGLALAQAPLFTAPRDFAVGFNPLSVAVGDFNGDLKQDLAVTNYNSNTVSVLLGVGNGTFQPAVTLLVGANPMAVAVGDFQRHGKFVLGVAKFRAGTVSVLVGEGLWKFPPAQDFTASSLTTSVDLSG